MSFAGSDSVVKPRTSQGGLEGIDVLVVPSGGRAGRGAQGRAAGSRRAPAVGPGRRSHVGYKFGALVADRIGLTSARFVDSPYQIEGTLIRVHVDRWSPLPEGVGASVWVLFSDATRCGSDRAPRVAPAPKGGLATSGLALHTQMLAGQPAAVDEAFGRGRVVPFPLDLDVRGMSQGTQRPPRNAIFGR